MFWDKRLLSLFIAIFVLIPVVYSAEQFYVELNPINEKIFIDEGVAASFYLRIINNLGIMIFKKISVVKGWIDKLG